jgi:hypothetical protein
MRASRAVATREQLDWESRWGKPAAIAAILGALLSIGAVIVRLSALRDNSDTDRDLLLAFDDHSGSFAASLALQVVAFFLIAGALYYLTTAAIARRPELPRAMVGFLILAPLLLALGGILDQLSLRDAADTYTSSGAQNVARAEQLLDDRTIYGAIVGSIGTLCLAVSFVFVSVNAMRVGLVSRFMGIMGIVVGALLVLPLVPGGQAILQLFWLVWLGVLFLDRYPGGRGPAWATGEAIEWPSARQALGPGPDDGAVTEVEPAAAGNGDSASSGRSSRKKRKRR